MFDIYEYTTVILEYVIKGWFFKVKLVVKFNLFLISNFFDFLKCKVLWSKMSQTQN